MMLARDIALVRLTGAPMHFLHLSTAGSVELVRAAKADGLAVTAEVTPHHLALSDAAVQGYDPVFKVNPPLRSLSDVAALRAGLASGVIDAVATDHAPHAPERKEEPFDEAPAGMLGLETALAVTYGAVAVRAVQGADEPDSGWVPPGEGAPMSLRDLIGAFSWKPARIAGLDRERPELRGGQGGPIRPGAIAHLTVFDPATGWVVNPGYQASRSRNTPYGGRRLIGKVRHTVLAGVVVVLDGEAQR
jgi:dihydroorotase